MKPTAAIAALLSAITLVACGSDSEGTSTSGSQQAPQAPTKTVTKTVQPSTASQTPTAPESATDTSGGSAPDSGISTRPGGPGDDAGSGGGY